MNSLWGADAGRNPWNLRRHSKTRQRKSRVPYDSRPYTVHFLYQNGIVEAVRVEARSPQAALSRAYGNRKHKSLRPIKVALSNQIRRKGKAPLHYEDYPNTEYFDTIKALPKSEGNRAVLSSMAPTMDARQITHRGERRQAIMRPSHAQKQLPKSEWERSMGLPTELFVAREKRADRYGRPKPRKLEGGGK